MIDQFDVMTSTPLIFSPQNFPSFDLLSQMKAFGSHTPAENVLTGFSNALSTDVQTDIVHHFVNRRTKGCYLESFDRKLQALMPDLIVDSTPTETDSTQRHDAGAFKFLKLIMFMASNNMLDPELNISSKVFRTFQHKRYHHLVEYLASLKGPAAEALVESLFRLAMNAEDFTTAQRFIKSGLNPNEQVIVDQYAVST
ncbi:uncharacterized protein BDZ99DRAFT_207514 [Mytilinidion resinicola]|uniref:Uncharacterized protein n=1 Tax=Mytilinidion resinicola TaxID=574789 RepID=A0A6A6Y0E4_9PEZI|nr:uncharacterized protein BDZ99DRAFT_207514 [Mytilinidion resinicola]KAF2802281.1 hypothetical protein BDZ99DRAFT_207514 [Mytilinidion resinicola]